jgi:transposase InsO family protein
MDLHENARSCRASRELLVKRVQEGWKVKRAAQAAGMSERRAYHWLKRYREEGKRGLTDRSCRPLRVANKTPKRVRARIVQLRYGRLTCREIAAQVGVSSSTVARTLAEVGLQRLKALQPKQEIRRYERRCAGELLHLDIKKLGRIGRMGHRVTGDKRRRSRGVGWEFVHVCVDDASRLAYVEILDDEKGNSAATFLRRALAWFHQLGVRVQRVMTDNGSCYISRAFAQACRALSLRHLRTRPYRPQTNGKAERYIQTLLREWAYRFPYYSSQQRAARLIPYLHFYNFHRAHASLNRQPPVARLSLNNVMRLHS